MRLARISPVVIGGVFAAFLAGCGSSESNDKGKVDPSSQKGVGRYGGDCRDGMKRCNDEFGAPLCPVAVGYDGDDLAVCEPAGVEEGILLHYGPKSYDDPDEISKYVLPAFEEDENCVYVRTTNTEPIYISRYHGRMRPNSHHLIVTIADELPDGVELGEPTRCDQADAIGSRWLLGSQDPQIDLEVEGSSPGSLPSEPGDPEFGLGQVIQPNTLLRIDMHYVNTTDQDILREAWVYLKAVPKEKVLQYIDMITMFQVAIDIPPNTKGVTTTKGRCRVPSDRYIGMVTGHFHENGTRFSVWYERAGGEPELIYQTRDWDVPGNAFYTDRIENPSLDGDGVWGAASGYIEAKEGDYLIFECEFDNPTDRRVTFGETAGDQMCNVFGYYYPSDGDVWNCACAGGLCI